LVHCTEIRALGILEPISGKTNHINLGEGSAPHGVIVGPDEAPWITDGGLNAIVRVDPITKNVTVYSLPENTGNANLNTASFDHMGILWFTGQSGIYGKLDPNTGKMEVFKAPRGIGPYGISTTPYGHVYFVSLAGSYLAQIDLETGNVTIIDPPTADQGARRVWSDSTGNLWITE
jgi:virginiamycin B lyase